MPNLESGGADQIAQISHGNTFPLTNEGILSRLAEANQVLSTFGFTLSAFGSRSQSFRTASKE